MEPFDFIVGKGRSGTTLVRAMLTSHPRMAIPPETHFIVPLADDKRIVGASGEVSVNALVGRLAKNPGFRRMELTADEVREALRRAGTSDYAQAVRAIFALYARKASKDRYGDKSPGQVLHIERLAGMFPEASFIHVIRDGRNVLLSGLETSFGPMDVFETAVVWRRLVLEGLRAGRLLGEKRYCEVRYEDLIGDPEGEIKRLSAFAGLEYDASMLRYFEHAEDLGVDAFNHRNINRPPTAGLRDWRRDMTPRQLAIFESLAGDTLSDLGYARAGIRMGVRDKAHLSAMWLSFQSRRTRWRFKHGTSKARARSRVPFETRA
ncbi:MAG: sulfotransferase family protein [Actinomycetota bacterium]